MGWGRREEPGLPWGTCRACAPWEFCCRSFERQWCCCCWAEHATEWQQSAAIRADVSQPFPTCSGAAAVGRRTHACTSTGYDAGRYEGSGGGRYGDDGGAAYRDPGYSSRDAALYGAAAAPRERAYDARDPYYAAGAAGGGSAARSDPRGGYPPSSREAAPYSSSYGASGGGGYGYAPRDEYDDRGGGAPRSDRYAAAAAPVASRGDYPPSGSGRAPSGAARC